MSTPEEGDLILKVVVVGETGVGKSNIVTRFATNSFNETAMPTIGVDLIPKTVTIDQTRLTVQLWDTAGQERMRALASSYYKNAKGVLLVYDITSKETFERLRYWLKEVKKTAGEGVKVMIIGNKRDLMINRQVSEEEATTWAKEKGYFYMEVSAKTNEGGCVNKAVEALVRDVLKDMKQEDLDLLKKEAELKVSTLRDVQSARQQVKEQKKCC